MEKTKYNLIDLCKLIMAFCVVAIHTCPLNNYKNEMVLLIYNSFVDIAVPFFFLASGFLLANKFQYPFDSDNNIQFIRNYLLRIIKLYVMWSLIYLPLAIWHYISTQTNVIKSVLSYIRGFVFIGEHYNSWPLWYLLSTIYALALIIFLLKRQFTLKTISLVGCFLFVLSLGITQFVGFDGGGGLPRFITLVQKVLIYSVANGRILTGAFYIPIGMLLSREKIPLKLSIVLMVGGFALNVATNNIISSSILVAVSAIGFFSVVEKINLNNSSFYPFVRNVSTYIYFLHMYIWTGYYTIKYGQRTYGLDSFMVTLMVSFIISVSFVYLCNKKKQRGHKNSTKHLGNVIIELPRND